MTPDEGEETLQERRERLLRSESAVELMQEKERILEVSYYRTPVKRIRREEGEGEGNGELGMGEVGATESSGVELGRAAVESLVASGGLQQSTCPEKENQANLTTNNDPPTAVTKPHTNMTDDSPYTVEVIVAHDDGADRKPRSAKVQLGLDFAATALMLIGLLGMYGMVVG